MARPSLLARLFEAQAQRARGDLLRRVRTIDDVDGARIVIDGQSLINFASNDYLGLAQHPALQAALVRGATEWGVGATASHLLGGHRREHERLERKLAEWTGRERALLFSTGYMANLAVIATLLRDRDVCMQDKLNHACLIDGARLAGCELKRYLHADVDSARRQLRLQPERAALLATDGVFSMDGDIAPLASLAALCKEESATLFVDDAHGIGVVGNDGSGSVRAAGLNTADVPLLMATFGKALGTSGAFVAGAADVIDALAQFARTSIYTTATAPALAAATGAAIDVARFENWRRDKLRALIAHFGAGARRRGITLLSSSTPIQPVLIGDAAHATSVSQALETAGFYVPSIRPPTVAEGTARLRVTLTAAHAESDVEALLDGIARALERQSAPRRAVHTERARRARSAR
jgi:8-amino-7-oxononanoate synthase